MAIPVDRYLANVAVVLKTPKHPENIGAAARCAMNMGIAKIVMVSDHMPDREKMLAMATHRAAHLIEAMECHADVPTALAPFSYTIGTTARLGRHRRALAHPRDMAREIIPILANNRVALLFGPEDRGLTNEDLQYCNLTTTIPTADFSSLNLAQAVAILCYELRQGLLQLEAKPRHVPKLANTHELEGMYEHVDLVLQKANFLRTEDSAYWLRNIRQVLGRVELRAKEVRVIRGVCRQLLWYDSQRNAGTGNGGVEPGRKSSK